jgi:hypothetical protein
MNRRTVILALALVSGAVGAYAAWPREADLRGFEPAENARLETAMQASVVSAPLASMP